MKKIFMLLVMLIPLLVLAQGQPAASNVGFKSTLHFDAPSGNRSIPPGLLVWSQLPNCENAYACQLDLVTPFDAKAVDDFMFASSPGQITAVRWWNLWFNPPQYAQPSSFNIVIYDDNNCVPGNIVGTWIIPFANANEDAGCSVSYPSAEYWATLSPAFNPVPGMHYWLLVQPVMPFSPQVGTMSSLTQNLCSARQDFPYIGIYWVDLQTDLAFELYAGGPAATPVSTWALMLGGVLIAAAIFLRYRRVS